MSSENRIIELPVSKIKVELVPFLTAGVFMDLSKQTDQTKYMIEQLVVSLDGKTEKIYEEVRGLRYKDWKFLDHELTAMVSEDTEEKKD